MWTILALLLMIVLGGFISYYGDLQGRRWGKKKVSWFRMRPKHTAILITSLTGGLIALLSIMTLLLISPTVRDVVLTGERAIRDNKQLNRRLLDQARYFKIEQYNQHQLLASKREQNRIAEQQLNQTSAELQGAKAALPPLKRDIVELTRRVAEKQRTLAHLQAVNQTLVATNRSLGITNRQFGRQNLALERLNLVLKQEKVLLAQSNLGLKKANVSLKSTNEGLAFLNNSLRVQGETIEKKNRVLLGSNQMMLQLERDLNSRVAVLRQKNDALQTQLEQNQRDLEQVYGRLVENQQAFTVNYIAVRQGQIGLRAGSELARVVLDAHLRPAAIAAQLRLLLQEASKTAVGYGARPGENGRAVSIVRKQLAALAGAENSDEETSLLSMAQTLAGSDEAIVVVARAFSNTLAGEQVPVNLDWRNVTRSFEPGQILASGRIDGSRPDSEVRQSITRFLTTDVRNAAIKAGIIPHVDPSTGISEVGQFDPFDLVSLVQQARRLGREGLLRAVAITPITSADPLDRQRLRLELIRTPRAAP